MQIIDADGTVIEITDLSEAIKQADLFSNYALADTTFKRLSEERQAYWTDMLSQLLMLQSEIFNKTI